MANRQKAAGDVMNNRGRPRSETVRAAKHFTKINMTDVEKNFSQARLIITSACKMLQNARESAPRFGQERYASNADCYILLADATKIFCQHICECHGEPLNKRWSDTLPELLLSHPEKCDETLALLEEKEFKGLSYFQFVAA